MYNPYDTEKYPKRKNTRLRDFDYSSENCYFVTICTFEKICLFGEPGKLNGYGEYASQGMKEISEHYPSACVEKFVVMPNHVHALIYLTGGNANLARVIASYKSFVTKQIHENEPGRVIWQRSFHDHIVRNKAEYQKIWSYIDSNPDKWKEDCFYQK